MARIRSIKPEFWDDEKLAQLPRDVRLLYIGLWNFSDDFGVVKANPVWLKSKVFPYDEIQLAHFRKWLEMLERPGFSSPGGSMAWAVQFQANGEAFYYLPNFSRHQRVEKPSTFNRNPEPPKEIKDWKPTPPVPLGEPSPTPPVALPAVLEGIGEGREGISAAPRKHAFEKSPYFPFEKFREALPEWTEEKCREYFERAEGYSKANGGRYLDWRQAVMNWDRKDSQKVEAKGAPKKSRSLV